MNKVLDNAFKYTIFILLILSLSSSIIATLKSVIHFAFNDEYFVSYIFLAIVVISVVVFFLMIIRYLVRIKILLKIKEIHFLAIIGSCAFLVSLASILIIDQRILSDFLAYHVNAVKISNGEYPVHHLISNLGNLYLRRPLVNLVPLYLIFGPDLLIMQVFNALVHISTGLLLYFFIKDSFNNRLIARLSLIFFFCIPITYITLNIPSHDIPGLFYMMLCFFLFGKLNKKLQAGSNFLQLLIISLSLGLGMFILQLSRSTGIFLYYAILMMTALFVIKSVFRISGGFSGIYLLKKGLFLFIIPLITYYLINSFLNDGNLGHGRFMMMFVATDTSESCQGAYSDIADYKAYYGLLKGEVRDKISLGKLGSELYYNYPDFLKLLVRKNDRLYGLGDHFSWALGDTQRKYYDMMIYGLSFLNKIVRLFLYFFAIVGSVYLIRKLKTDNPFSLAVFSGLLCAVMLIFIGEVSPRYSHLFLIHISVLSAIGFLTLPILFSDLKSTFLFQKRRFYRKSVVFIIVTIACISFIAGLKPLIKFLVKDSDIVYRDLSMPVISAPIDQQELNNAIKPLTPQEKPLKFGFKLPAGARSIEAAWDFKVKPAASYHIRGFLRERANRPEEINTYLSVDNTDRINLEETFEHPIGLKKLNKYTVRYLSVKPVMASGDRMSIRLALELKDELVSGDEISEMSDTYIEFLQVVEVDHSPKHNILHSY